MYSGIWKINAHHNFLKSFLTSRYVIYLIHLKLIKLLLWREHKPSLVASIICDVTPVLQPMCRQYARSFLGTHQGQSIRLIFMRLTISTSPWNSYSSWFHALWYSSLTWMTRKTLRKPVISELSTPSAFTSWFVIVHASAPSRF